MATCQFLNKEYVCQHSSYNKSNSKKLRNCDCLAYVRITVKLTTTSTKKNDKFVKDGLPAKIYIKLTHTHTLKTAAALGLLRPGPTIRATFENYFSNGLGIGEAISFHEATFDHAAEDAEDLLANACLNPKRRSVQYWHEEWRKVNFGPRGENIVPKNGKDIYEVMSNKREAYREKGITINFTKDPQAIVVVTPLMQRAHMLPLARDIVFVDSTSSCNSENHAVTFLLTLCAAGAVPLGIIITGGQTIPHYVAGFQLLQDTVVKPFGGVGFPTNFMTDDGDAERKALKAVWGDSNRFLCHFHMSQAVWRWLRKAEHKIAENDRQSLYRSFKLIMQSLSKEEACEKYKSFEESDLAGKYQNFHEYVNGYWDRKEEWVLAFRNVALHNNHTNNYCESSVRLFKDLVLGRSKAYNIVALVDYTSILLEDYYLQRLRRFAHNRCAAPKLALNHTLAKAAYLKEDHLIVVGNGVYSVPSEKSPTKLYTVDTELGSCTCPAGQFGGFCKHQAAVFFYFQQASPSTPGVTQAARYEIAVLAFGEGSKPQEFYQPLQPEVEKMEVEEDMTSMEVVPKSPGQSSSSVSAPSTDVPPPSTNGLAVTPSASNVNEATTEVIKEICEAIMENHSRFGSSMISADRFSTSLRKVTTKNGWESFLSCAGVLLRGYRRGGIKVQPTSISRRRAGVTRGSRRLPAGRPAASDVRRKKKRRNLAENVRNNVDNAKTH